MVNPIARRYARALLEVAAEQDAIDVVGRDMDDLAAAVRASPPLREVFENPSFSRDDRHLVFGGLTVAMKLSELVVRFVKLLIDRGRSKQIPEIARVYRDLADERAGRARAQVWTATPLSAALTQGLQQALTKLVKRDVQLEAEVDPALLGGAVAQVGSLRFDGSISGRLRELRRDLKNV